MKLGGIDRRLVALEERRSLMLSQLIGSHKMFGENEDVELSPSAGACLKWQLMSLLNTPSFFGKSV